jgi:hypothetical protein
MLQRGSEKLQKMNPAALWCEASEMECACRQISEMVRCPTQVRYAQPKRTLANAFRFMGPRPG